MTYKEVARAVGRPGAAQAVGAVLKMNYDPEIPCHRVVRSDGKAGGYNRGEKRKMRLLKEEGVSLKNKNHNMARQINDGKTGR